MRMFKIIFICFIIFNKSQSKFVTKHFKTYINHFNLSDHSSFRIRYLMDDEFYNAGPMFFYTGNEGDIALFAENSKFVYELAKIFSGLIVYAEHRYYGLSVPILDKNQNKMQFLTSEQALLDYITLIKHLKATYNKSMKIIVFGGSYGGMLAAWIKAQYPNIIDGALAASAPILDFYGNIPCDKFLNIVSEVFKNASSKCFLTVKNSWNSINELFETKNSSLAELHSIFNLCPNQNLMFSDKDIFKSWIQDILVTMSMANYPYPTDFLGSMPAWPIKYACNSLNYSDNSTIYEKLYRIISVNLNYTGETLCNNYTDYSNKKMLPQSTQKFRYLKKYMLNEKSQLNVDNWFYQSCEEMVLPFCSSNNSENNMFEATNWNFTEYAENCKMIFNITPRPEWLSQYYGSLLNAKNIIFTNGLLDPWSGGGIYYNVSSRDILSLVIPEGAHHLDLRGANPLDPESVKIVRRTIIQYIGKWIQPELPNTV